MPQRFVKSSGKRGEVMKKIEKVAMFCPFCEEEHTVDFVDNPDAEVTIDGQKNQISLTPL